MATCEDTPGNDSMQVVDGGYLLSWATRQPTGIHINIAFLYIIKGYPHMCVVCVHYMCV